MILLHDHEDFANFIQIVSQKRSIPDAIVEKDYWVTYVLHELNNSDFKEDFIFKGGTSLSKGWKMLDRFSEDIDLLILARDLSRTGKSNRLKKIQKFISELPGLTFDPDNPDNRGAEESRTSCFKYRKRAQAELVSVLTYIKVEMGYRGGVDPNTFRPIQSLIAEELEGQGQKEIAVNIVAINICTLAPHRTFTEKLFAIHSAYESGQIQRKIRHYYDVFKLLHLDEVLSFLGTPEYESLKKDVADFSSENWPGAPLPPDNNFKNSAAFNPSQEKLKDMQAEYDKSDLYYGSKIPFSEIIKKITEFRNRF